MSSPEKTNLPLGSGAEFAKERRKETLPALEVKNEVIWVNPAFKDTLPFKIEEGKPTKLGVFFTPRPEAYSDEKPKKMTIMPEWGPGRSGLVGEVVFQDKEERQYRDTDLKGMGGFSYRDYDGYGRGSQKFVMPPRPKKMHELSTFGLIDYGYALTDRDNSEMLLKEGLRTHRVVAFIELKEVIGEYGKRISIDDAKKTGMIPKDESPVIEMRAFATKERIDYLEQGDATFTPEARRAAPKTRRLEALKDAMAPVEQELGEKPGAMSTKKYLRWFAETLGTQIAKLRKLGLHHGYLTAHNITLDCRIVDLDSLTKMADALRHYPQTGIMTSSEEKLYADDYNLAEKSLLDLKEALDELYADIYQSRGYPLKIFEEAYRKELGENQDKKPRGPGKN